jgi:GNAT superfamily N-acetyltransferase
MTIRDATSEDLDEIRKMLLEYEAWIGVDLCFQNFKQELAELPGKYAPPRGRLLIADPNAGCVALRPIDDETGEMKRLFVRPEFRGTGLGKLLVLRVIEEARAEGYKKVRLDTMPMMESAQKLYQQLGFRDIEAYRLNPQPGVRYMELSL